MLVLNPAVNENRNGKRTNIAAITNTTKYIIPMNRPIGERHSVFDITPRLGIAMEFFFQN
jgi:hypothetical protein